MYGIQQAVKRNRQTTTIRNKYCTCTVLVLYKDGKRVNALLYNNNHQQSARDDDTLGGKTASAMRAIESSLRAAGGAAANADSAHALSETEGMAERSSTIYVRAAGGGQ